jgi:hypothetical protein
MTAYRFSHFIKAFALILFIIGTINVYAQFAGGSGTQNDPYLIQTAAQLDSVRNHLDCSFRQISDIHLNVVPYNQGTGWQPIGTYINDHNWGNRPFTGTYDGNGCFILGLYINSQSDGAGLFRYVQNARLNNISFLGCSITGNKYCGSLAGIIYYSEVVSCGVQGTTIDCNGYPNGYTGGLVGKARYTAFDDCSALCTITGTSYDVGGLVGSSFRSSFTDSYSWGEVSGSSCIGGLVGHLDYSTINTCYSLVDVASSENAGGLVGNSYHIVCNNSFSRGSVSGSQVLGGLIGSYLYGTVYNCYSTGHVTPAMNSGGLIGGVWYRLDKGHPLPLGSDNPAENEPDETNNIRAFINSYWDTETSGYASSFGGLGRTTEQMTYPYGPDTYVGWDFESVWDNDLYVWFNGGYPMFYYMIPVGNIDDNNPAMPEIALFNYPNPFKLNTTIHFDIPKSAKVNLSIYNSKGQLVRTLTDSQFSKGEHTLAWDGKTDANQQCANGIYLYRLQGTGLSLTKKLMLMK